MNLKQYIGRQLILTEENTPYKWEFYPHGSSKYPMYSIDMCKGEGIYENPDYSLSIKVTGENRILEIVRITNGYCLAFPEEIEVIAEDILNKVTTGNPRPMWNYSMSGEIWKELLEQIYCSVTLKLRDNIFHSKWFVMEDDRLLWYAKQCNDICVEILYDKSNFTLKGFSVLTDKKISKEIHESFCSSMFDTYMVQ